MSEPAIEDLLPEDDRDFLAEKGFKYTAQKENDCVLVVLQDFEFPEKYTPRTSSLLIRIPAGYPDAKLDMFWTRPDVKLLDGNWPHLCQGRTLYLGAEWQQWSRHFTNIPWRPGVDNLRTFVTVVRKELKKGI